MTTYIGFVWYPDKTPEFFSLNQPGMTDYKLFLIMFQIYLAQSTGCIIMPLFGLPVILENTINNILDEANLNSWNIQSDNGIQHMCIRFNMVDIEGGRASERQL